ncbi:hypothetical protein BU14_0136s0006 [Porphyra umbilicalis]|uniref:Uncharacterized protein n=1 Tax=Porphyra umbilicalis TaxID=2786 RepID=A0A1X6PA28_PORUM|nr:hypothetical protein BU14_0136s0006 [Porphyra umbilicalis]|eukprot:OSX77708.1 hypothetical protein BU14_0136s0006 [Porphyra umbilicalis]
MVLRAPPSCTAFDLTGCPRPLRIDAVRVPASTGPMFPCWARAALGGSGHSPRKQGRRHGDVADGHTRDGTRGRPDTCVFCGRREQLRQRLGHAVLAVERDAAGDSRQRQAAGSGRPGIFKYLQGRALEAGAGGCVHGGRGGSHRLGRRHDCGRDDRPSAGRLVGTFSSGGTASSRSPRRPVP